MGLETGWGWEMGEEESWCQQAEARAVDLVPVQCTGRQVQAGGQVQVLTLTLCSPDSQLVVLSMVTLMVQPLCWLALSRRPYVWLVPSSWWPCRVRGSHVQPEMHLGHGGGEVA